MVAQVRALPGHAFVLDGETLALDDDGRPRAFQDTMSRFGSDGNEQTLLSPFFFDLLHLDGTDLIDEPLDTRLDALAGLLADHPPLRMPGVRRPTPEQAATVLDDALTAGHEGVVAKALDAPYAAGRRGKAWQKVKPVHTLDLVVLGAEWGYGRRTGSLSNIHLGARDPNGGEPIMVGKTFKGMTDELLAWQTATFPGLARAEDGSAVRAEDGLPIPLGPCCCGRSWSSRSRWTAPSAARVTLAASRCASPVWCATAPTRPPPRPTPSTRCARSCPNSRARVAEPRPVHRAPQRTTAHLDARPRTPPTGCAVHPSGARCPRGVLALVPE